PDAWETLASHLVGLDFSREAVLQSGLIRPGKQDRGDYDMFRNRLLFPIHDTQGRIVAFGGRVLDGSLPKYINSPESPVYHKGQVLYGLYQAMDAMRHSGDALVVEGYFDVMALHRVGFTHSLAPCGTALTPEHARLLKRFAERVLLVFDQDQAGRQATFKAMDVLLPTGLEVVVVSLPEGSDPDSLLLKAGTQAFQDCLDQARPALDVFIEEQFSLQEQSIESQVRAAELVMQRIRRLPNELQRDLYVKRLAELTGLDRALLLGKAGQQASPAPRRASPNGVQPSVRKPVVRQETAATRSQVFLLRLMLLNDPTIRTEVRQAQTEDLFLDPLFKDLADYLLSRESAEGCLPDDLCSPALSEEQQTLLSSLLVEDEDPAWQEGAERIFADCRRAVHQARLRSRLYELDHREREARACSDEQTLNQCLQERMAITSELKKKF
ncbi:MAG: DNA primase, partial [Desulfuromonas sp.]